MMSQSSSLRVQAEPFEPLAAKTETRTPLLFVRNLRKAYGGNEVLKGVTFEVYPGEIFGFLGSNGAGKTTTLEIIEGLRQPDSGEICMFGSDPRRNARRVRERIGVSLQKSTFWTQLRVGELIALFRSFYRNPLPTATLLNDFALAGLESRLLKDLSGGQYQRVALCLAMVNDPDILLLDEPSIGLDPEVRRNLWDVLERMKEKGKTIILTTHYMEEAQALSDRVAILSQGRIVQCGTPAELISSLRSSSSISFCHDGTVSADRIKQLPWCCDAMATSSSEMVLFCSELRLSLFSLLTWAQERDVHIDNVRVREPNLEDVFLRYSTRE